MILEKIFRKQAQTISTSEELSKALLAANSGPTASGQSVTEKTARSSSGFYGCVLVLSQTLAQVPLELYRRNGKGDKERAKDHKLYKLLHLKPNQFQTSYAWREMMQGHAAATGNAYSYISRIKTGPNAGTIKELLPINPSRVEVEQDENYNVIYNIKMSNGAPEPFKKKDILHIKGLSVNGISGLSHVEEHKEAIGLSQALEKHGAKLFANGVQLSGIAKHPGTLSDIAYGRLKESLSENNAGADNAFKTLILEEDMDWLASSMTNEAAEFIETRKFQIEELARLFRVPLILLGHSDKSATYASVEQFLLAFAKFTMARWFVNWEQELSIALLNEQEQDEYLFEFNMDGLLRGDAKTRSQYYKDGVLSGWLAPNEPRRWENLPQIEGLDYPITPANITGNDNAKTE